MLGFPLGIKLISKVNGLIILKEYCHWTEGSWNFGDGRQRKWNELQNIPRDIQMLAMYLLCLYRANHTIVQSKLKLI